MHVSSGQAEQPSHSQPEGLQTRNSVHESCRPQAPAWNHSFVTFFHGLKKLDSERQELLQEWGFFYLVMLSGTTHFTSILWIERRLGAGVWGNGLEKENGRNVQLHLSQIISSRMWLHFLKSVRPTDIAHGYQVAFLCPLISVVKFYGTEVFGGGCKVHYTLATAAWFPLFSGYVTIN